MRLLKLTLVILLSEIAERTMCSDSDPSSSAKENAPVTWPQKSLLNASSSSGCTHQEIPYFDDAMGSQGGFLAVNCTKSCPEGKQENVVQGYQCVAKLESSNGEEVNVLVGYCDKGSCKPYHSPQHRTVSLITEEEEEEGEEEGEEEEDEEEDEEEE
uniref:Putative secreted salivary gland peptide n=1 Tax=Ixodes ricinus TaxID=34613 RepID=A0A0K8R9N5_IXORI